MHARDESTTGPGATHAARGGPARPASGPATLLAMQSAAGNAAVSRSVVQRAITVGKTKISSPSALGTALGMHRDLLSDTAKLVLKWAFAGKANIVVAKDDDLVVEADRIAAMVDLVFSILDKGILGRRTLTGAGMSFTGSNDMGDTTDLAVNVLDTHGMTSPGAVGKLVHESLTDPKRGSFSVAMERPMDDDMIVDQLKENRVEPTDEERQQAKVMAEKQGSPEFAPLLLKKLTDDRLAKEHEKTVDLNRPVLKDRVRNTVMAIMAQPGKDVAVRKSGGGYESSVPSDKIPPGKGGFTTLVFPQWFKQWQSLVLSKRAWPKGVEIQYVGDRQITAHYRAAGEDWPITVDAPDYASAIGAQLAKFESVATHILKTDGAA